MKNFPFIPLMMWTAMMMVIIHGHRVSRQNKLKVEYSMAAGVDAHLAGAREAFVTNDRVDFMKEIEEAISLLTKEAYCDKCLDKEVAQASLPPLVSLKHHYENENLNLGDMDKVFGQIVTALAKNHIVYTLEHLNNLEDEFYVEDVIRHLKFSMKYFPENVREKEAIAAEALEEALTTHKFDQEATKKILSEVVASI